MTPATPEEIDRMIPKGKFKAGDIVSYNYRGDKKYVLIICLFIKGPNRNKYKVMYLEDGYEDYVFHPNADRIFNLEA